MKSLINWVLACIIIMLVFLQFKSCESHQSDLELIDRLNDTIVKWKDSYGNEHSKIRALETTSVDLFTKLETTNETLQELQELVKRNKKKKIETATVVRTVTKIDTMLVPVYMDSLPTYRLKNKHVDLYAAFKSGNKLETKISFTSYLRLLYHYERKNIFSKRYLVVEAIEDNPYMVVDDIRTLKIPVRTKRLGIGPFIGIDYGLRPSFGIGVSYNVFYLY